MKSKPTIFSKRFYCDLVTQQKDDLINGKITVDEELVVRNILSRSYYTAVLYCARELQKLNPNLNFDPTKYHYEVADKLRIKKSNNSNVLRLLGELKIDRILADYHPNNLIKNKTTTQDVNGNPRIIDIEQTVKNMEDVIASKIYL